MSGTANVLGTVGAGDRAMLPLARWKTPRAARRVPAADQLIAPPCEVAMPTLEKVPTEQRFSADDREVIALAEILVKSDIAAVEDWEKSGRDAIKYLLLTLQRWIRNHGGASIQRRFDLDLTLSDRLVDYSDERGPEGTLYLIVDPDSAAFVLLNPTIELLGSVHPRLPATFLRYFVGSLNRWVRVYDYHDAQERVNMLREWYEGEENPEQYEVPDIEGCTPKCLEERALGSPRSEGTKPQDPEPASESTGQRFAGVALGLEAGQTAGLHRGHGRATDGLESTIAMSARGTLIGRRGGWVL